MFASASSRGLSAPACELPSTGHGQGMDAELGRGPGFSSEASPYTAYFTWQGFSSLVSWSGLPSYDPQGLFYKFYLFQVKKEDLGAGMRGINGGRNICLWNAGGFKISWFFFFSFLLFHKKEHSPWLHTQTSDLKIAKFHLDCGGVKDRRQMHWLPARLDIHFFFPHPRSQQLHTRAQVRSLVHCVCLPLNSLTATPQPCIFGSCISPNTLFSKPGMYQNPQVPPICPA